MAEAVGYLILTPLLAEATAFGTVSVVSATAATVVGSAALLGASLALSYALTPSPTLPKPSDGTQPLKQAVPPRSFGYGRCRISGAYVLYEAVDVGDGWSVDILALHQGKIGTIYHYFLNEDLVYLDADNEVAIIADADDGRYGAGGANDNVLIFTRAGLDTETAYANPIQGASVLPSYWTSAHRGDGIASLLLACRQTDSVGNFPRRFPRGVPKPSVVADLSRVYDPRDPLQDREDPDTWTQGSTNPVLQLLDYLTHTDRGPGLDWDDCVEPVVDALMAEADLCDELVARADGTTEKRYESHGWAFINSEPADVIAQILATCDGWLAENGDGTIALTVGSYRAPTVTLKDDHILGFTLDKGVADEEIVNEIQWSFTAPGNDYREAPGAAWRDEASVAEIGRIRSENKSLGWVQSHTQGRRLVKRMMARHQATLRGTLITNLYGLQVLGQRWVKVQSRTVADFSDLVIEITRARIEIASGRVSLEWVSVNPNAIDAWDAATEEGTAPQYDSRLTPLPLAMALANSSSAIQVTFTEPPGTRSDLGFAVEWRVNGSGGAWTRQTFTLGEVSDLGATWRVTTAVLAPATYEVRLAAIGLGAAGALSSWTTSATVAVS